MRLLQRCEQRALNLSPDDWRQERFISSLRDMLKQLGTNNGNFSKPASETLVDYKNRINLLETSFLTHKEKCQSLDKDENKENVEENPANSSSAINNPNYPPNIVDESKGSSFPATSTKPHVELQAKTKAQELKDLRSELLGGYEFESSDLRSRTHGRIRDDEEEVINDEVVQQIMNRHNAMQEKVAGEMLMLAQSLKQSTLAASEIINADQTTLVKANESASNNYDKLKIETERVGKQTALGCQWWLFVILAVVAILFLWVVFLIRIT